MAKPRALPKSVETFSSKEWVPCLFHDRKNADGSFNVSEGFKNIHTDEEVTPRTKRELRAGPPGFKSGVVAVKQHGDGPFTDEFWESMKEFQPLGEVVLQKNGRTVIRYD